MLATVPPKAADACGTIPPLWVAETSLELLRRRPTQFWTQRSGGANCNDPEAQGEVAGTGATEGPAATREVV